MTKTGLIDRKEVFKLAHGVLKLPFGSLDNVSAIELSWLWQSHNEQQEEEFELFNHTIKTSIASVLSNKDFKLFDKKKQDQVSNNTKRFASKEDKLKALDEIKSLF